MFTRAHKPFTWARCYVGVTSFQKMIVGYLIYYSEHYLMGVTGPPLLDAIVLDDLYLHLIRLNNKTWYL